MLESISYLNRFLENKAHWPKSGGIFWSQFNVRHMKRVGSNFVDKRFAF